MRSVCLVWLEWPEKCFRLDAGALRYLKGLVGDTACVVRARSEAAFLRALPQATQVIAWHFRKEWFARAPHLRLLATPGAGRELVTLEAPPGVRVHFGHFHGAIMAESVAGFMLAWARGFFRPEREAPGWQRVAMSDKCHLVAGSTAVIVGYGRVGQAIGEKLMALGVVVRGFGRRNIADLPTAVRTADWLVLALPSDTGTDNFLGAALLKKLPRRCVVINVGRGNAIDEEALLSALSSGRLAGAYLDVFKGEPGPLEQIVRRTESDGILGTDPKALPWNLIRTPHASAFANDYVLRCFRELRDDRCL